MRQVVVPLESFALSADQRTLAAGHPRIGVNHD